MGGGKTDMIHLPIRLPDSTGNHGWVATNTPDAAGSINRFEIETDHDATVGTGIVYDVLYFYANKKLTSKYTITGAIAANHKRDAEQVSQVLVVGSGISTVVCNDTTVTATYGLREQLIDDQNITHAQKADAYARSFLNAQDWDDTADPILLTIMNEGNMYNLMPGDTVTMTITTWSENMNLDNAKRSIIARQDSISDDGWLTGFQLSTTGYSDRITKIWEAAKRKRY
jgi:hypothetical protein